MGNFPAGKTDAVDNVTEVLAKHLNNLEDKVGIDGDDNENSLDYLIKKIIGQAVEASTSDGTIAGNIDGTNKTFTLPDAPISGTLDFYYEGQRLLGGAGNDFTISGKVVTMDFAPETETNLVAKYRKQI